MGLVPTQGSLSQLATTSKTAVGIAMPPAVLKPAATLPPTSVQPATPDLKHIAPQSSADVSTGIFKPRFQPTQMLIQDPVTAALHREAVLTVRQMVDVMGLGATIDCLEEIDCFDQMKMDAPASEGEAISDPGLKDFVERLKVDFPGRVLRVNKKFLRPSGRPFKEVDVVMDTVDVEFKSGTGEGSLRQQALRYSGRKLRRPHIFFGENLRPSSVRNLNRDPKAGHVVVMDYEVLRDLLMPALSPV